MYAECTEIVNYFIVKETELSFEVILTTMLPTVLVVCKNKLCKMKIDCVYILV